MLLQDTAGIAGYCRVLNLIAKGYYMVLHGIAIYCRVTIVWYCSEATQLFFLHQNSGGGRGETARTSNLFRKLFPLLGAAPQKTQINENGGASEEEGQQQR